METTRQNKVCRLIQKELSEIFLLQTKAMNGVLVSVSTVRISPDMSIVRAYLSVFPSAKAEEIVKNINNNSKAIRFELGTRVRHQLRIIPELKFFVDDSLDYVERIDELLKSKNVNFPSILQGVICFPRSRTMRSMSFQECRCVVLPSPRWHWYARCLFSMASVNWFLPCLRHSIRN